MLLGRHSKAETRGETLKAVLTRRDVSCRHDGAATAAVQPLICGVLKVLKKRKTPLLQPVEATCKEHLCLLLPLSGTCQVGCDVVCA